MSKGGGTPATTTQATQTQNAPWSGAVPYITSGLSSAQDLYNQGGPQYYPGETYALPNSGETSAISSLNSAPQTYAPLIQAGTGAVNSAINTGNNVTSNANSIFGNAGTIGSNANDIYNSSQGISDLANSIGQSAQNNPSNSFFQGLTTGNSNAPGFSTLQDYAGGKYLSADNPYFQQMSDTLKANILPGINAQFANSGRGNSGLAARAASEGLGDSIGNLAYQNYQQGLTQQQNAAGALTGLATTGATGLSNNFNTGIANQLNAGNLGLNAGNLGINAGNLGIGAGNLGLSAGNQAISGANLGLNAAQLGPLLQAMGLSADQAQLLAGQTQQGFQQSQDTDAQTRYNYNAQLPYQNLQNYIANITGQIGGTGSSSSTSNTTATPAQPSFFNQLLGGLAGVGSFFAAPTTSIGGKILGL